MTETPFGPARGRDERGPAAARDVQGFVRGGAIAAVAAVTRAPLACREDQGRHAHVVAGTNREGALPARSSSGTAARSLE